MLKIIDLNPISRVNARMLLSVRLLRAYVSSIAIAPLVMLLASPYAIIMLTLSTRPQTLLQWLGLLLIFLLMAVLCVALFSLITLVGMYGMTRIAAGSLRAVIVLLTVLGLGILGGFFVVHQALAEFSYGAALLYLSATGVYYFLITVVALGPIALLRARHQSWFPWCVDKNERRGWWVNVLNLLGLPISKEQSPLISPRAIGIAMLAFIFEGAGFTGYLKLGDSLIELADKSPQIGLVPALFKLVVWLFLGLSFTVLLCKIARRLRQRARGALQRLGEEIITSDKRPPVLFLRAFGDDHVSLKRLWLPLYMRVLDPGLVAETLEELIVRQWANIGPVLAIGKPDDQLRKQPIGAARYYLKEQPWQDFVMDLARNCATIILSIDESEGVMWEIDMLLTHNHMEKSILVIPPGYTKAGSVLSRLGNKLGIDLTPVADRHTVAVSCDRSGDYIVMTSTKVTELEYSLALKGAWLIQQAGSASSAETSNEGSRASESLLVSAAPSFPQ